MGFGWCKDRARNLAQPDTGSRALPSVVRDDAISARVLGSVEAPVGALHERFGRGFARGREGRTTDTDGHADRTSIGGDRELFHLRPQPFADGPRAGEVD